MVSNSSLQIKSFIKKLQEELRIRQLKNSRYSLRTFSRDLDVNYSILSRVMNNKIPYTKKLLLKIAETLPLQHDEVQYYLRTLDVRKRIRSLADLKELDPFVIVDTIIIEHDTENPKQTVISVENFLKEVSSGKYNLKIYLFES